MAMPNVRVEATSAAPMSRARNGEMTMIYDMDSNQDIAVSIWCSACNTETPQSIIAFTISVEQSMYDEQLRYPLETEYRCPFCGQLKTLRDYIDSYKLTLNKQKEQEQS